MAAHGEKGLPPRIRAAVGAVLYGVVPDGPNGGDGIDKDTALDYATDLAKWVKGLAPVGDGWCPVHGSALCPEQYMLRSDGAVGAGYSMYWHEGLRCGQRQPTYRAAPPIGSTNAGRS